MTSKTKKKKLPKIADEIRVAAEVSGDSPKKRELPASWDWIKDMDDKAHRGQVHYHVARFGSKKTEQSDIDGAFQHLGQLGASDEVLAYVKEHAREGLAFDWLMDGKHGRMVGEALKTNRDSDPGKMSIEEKQAALAAEPEAAAAAGCLEIVALTAELDTANESQRLKLLQRNGKVWAVWSQFQKPLAKTEGYRTRLEWSVSMGFSSSDDSTFREILTAGGVASRYSEKLNADWVGLQSIAPQAQVTCRVLCAGIKENGKTKRFPAVLETAELHKRLEAWNAEALDDDHRNNDGTLNESSVLDALRDAEVIAKKTPPKPSDDDADDAGTGTGTGPDEATTEPVGSVSERVDAARQAWAAAVDCLPPESVAGAVDVMLQAIKLCHQSAKKRAAGADAS